MLIISHRGNIQGSNCKLENNPNHISELLQLNKHIEIDVWYKNKKFYLGHDKAQYKVDLSFLKHKNLWCHAKNLDALQIMLNEKIHCFWHQDDNFTITSKGYIWTFPGKPTTKKSVIVDTKKGWRDKKYDCFGVCVDWVDG